MCRPALPCPPRFLAFLVAPALALPDTPTPNCSDVRALLILLKAFQPIPKMALLWRLRPADLWLLRTDERRESVEINAG